MCISLASMDESGFFARSFENIEEHKAKWKQKAALVARGGVVRSGSDAGEGQAGPPLTAPDGSPAKGPKGANLRGSNRPEPQA